MEIEVTNELDIASVKYAYDIDDTTKVAIDVVTTEGLNMSIPLSSNNRHYAEIMRRVEAGEITIEEA